MTAHLVRRLLRRVCTSSRFQPPAIAQEAVLTGTVTDSTGGVLPGVTVTAVHEATGNRSTAVTDERGIYRIPARVGAIRSPRSSPVFTTVTHRCPAARRSDRRGEPADVAVHRSGDGDRDR